LQVRRGDGRRRRRSQTSRLYGSNGLDPSVGWALGTIYPAFDELAPPIKRRSNHATGAALPISFRPALLAGISRTIANPAILDAVRDGTIFRGERLSIDYARLPGSTLEQRRKAIECERPFNCEVQQTG